MSLKLPKCEFCKHLHTDDEGNVPTCDAFPGGFLWKNISDDENAECANGIKFEEDEE